MNRVQPLEFTVVLRTESVEGYFIKLQHGDNKLALWPLRVTKEQYDAMPIGYMLLLVTAP